MNLLRLIRESERPLFAALLDPGKTNSLHWEELLQQGVLPDFFMVGGSTANREETEYCVRFLKTHQPKPVVLFPGNEDQISADADAILLLSLISGRNPEMLIGKQVRAAEELDEIAIEIIPTGYILVENGAGSAVQEVSQTSPISSTNTQLAAQTALAGQQLGLSLIYLEAGSGAPQPVPTPMIRAVSKRINIPLFVGGGIDNPQKCRQAIEAGADVIVAGNVLERKPEMILELLGVFRTVC